MFKVISVVSYVYLSTATRGETVYQNPSISIKDQNESAIFICRHDIPSYFLILWYKFPQDSLGLKLMGSLNGETENIETEFTNKAILRGNGRKNGTLMIKNLMESDSAVYFCAAYHTLL